MKAFLLGILLTIAAILVAGIFIAETGRVDMRADQTPPQWERRLAGGAMDASVDRYAPKATNPLQASTDNLVAGATVYEEHCAMCHGDPARPTSPVGRSLYPRAPQFVSDAADMGDSDNYYITEHGVRWTGMPAWKSVLSDKDIWEVVTFIGHMGNLPPEAKAVFALQAAPPEERKTKKQ
jgi:mono/diheme cytochrome c family protein